MKILWLKAQNDPNHAQSQDWNHTYTLSTTQIARTMEEDDDFVDILELEIDDDIVSEFYVVLYFFENYFCEHYVYKNLADATKSFYENISTRQDIRNEEEIQVIEKSYTGEITSTIYEESYSYNRKYDFPDKSTRWILKKFDMSDMVY